MFITRFLVKWLKRFRNSFTNPIFANNIFNDIQPLIPRTRQIGKQVLNQDKLIEVVLLSNDLKSLFYNGIGGFEDEVVLEDDLQRKGFQSKKLRFV